MRVFVFAGDDLRAGRTLRALAGRATVTDATLLGPAELARDMVDGCPEPAWLLRAGAWPSRTPAPPPPSATGLPLAAIGLVRGPVADAGPWAKLQSSTGGA